MPTTRIKTGPKIVGFLLVCGLLFGVYSFAVSHGYIGAPTKAAEVPKTVALTALAKTSPATTPQVAAIPMPGESPSGTGTSVGAELWPWNAEAPWLLANGGADTTSGSIFAKAGINMHIERKDDGMEMATHLIDFVTAYVKNPNAKGVSFIIQMGDGMPSWFADTNPKLAKVCPTCTAEIIGMTGLSAGEDKLMAPQAWKDSPQKALGEIPDPNPSKPGDTVGQMIAGVIRDGDWNTALKWAGDNALPNNPDEKTYDPDALNWLSVSTFTDAAQKYVEGVCETRPVVHAGKKTGETKKVCVDAVVTWTPGDVTVAKGRGGLVSIMSTKEYESQMPAVIIGIKKWNADHEALVEGLLQGCFDAADQIRSYPAALHRASEIAAKLYAEEDAAYWEKYFKGVIEPDKQGLQVSLGGSRVSNLADNKFFFGLTPGGTNLFDMTYTQFGDIAHQQYPKIVPSYPPSSSVLNLKYLQAVAARSTTTTSAEVKTFTPGSTINQVDSKRSWSIQFETGSAKLAPESIATMKKLHADVVITSDLIQIDGYTDNTGDANNNITLSKQRAQAVADWLQAAHPANYPPTRFSAINGYGQAHPVASNNSEEGRALNRRVQIVLGE